MHKIIQIRRKMYLQPINHFLTRQHCFLGEITKKKKKHHFCIQTGKTGQGTLLVPCMGAADTSSALHLLNLNNRVLSASPLTIF